MNVIKYTVQGYVILKTLWRRKVVLMKKKKSHFSLTIYYVLQTAEEMHLPQQKGSTY